MKKVLLFLSTFLIINTSFAIVSLDEQIKTGKIIFNKGCHDCHINGLANAPKVHDVAEWNRRFSAAMEIVKKTSPHAKPEELEAKTLDYLVAVVKKGKNAMPPGGMCSNCTDQQYKDAIVFMKSKNKEQQ